MAQSGIGRSDETRVAGNRFECTEMSARAHRPIAGAASSSGNNTCSRYALFLPAAPVYGRIAQTISNPPASRSVHRHASIAVVWALDAVLAPVTGDASMSEAPP